MLTADSAIVMPYRTLTLEIDGHIAILTLNRPEKRNAISRTMMDELLAALDEVLTSPARVGVLTGAGKAFCAGMDLEELKVLATQKPEQHREDSRRIAGLLRRIYSFPKPLIAAVNGPAIAGGCGLATLADFTLAAPEAAFGYTEVRIGFMPAIVSVFLLRQLGEKRARDLLLTGRIIGADEAYRLGLVNEIVPKEKLFGRAHELASALLEVSPTSLVYIKRLLREIADPDLEIQLEYAIEENARIRSTADFREGLASFLEKRKPQWRGE